MNIFNTINKRIRENPKETHVGTFNYEDMDAGDFDEIKNWKDNGSTDYFKEINGVEYRIVIEPKMVRGDEE